MSNLWDEYITGVWVLCVLVCVEPERRNTPELYVQVRRV
jgi:hypothetical protein